jgi:hypothetical protein
MRFLCYLIKSMKCHVRWEAQIVIIVYSYMNILQQRTERVKMEKEILNMQCVCACGLSYAGAEYQD